MVIDALSEFWVHEITVEAFEGTSGYGKPIYANPVTVVCFIDDRRRLVRDINGDQVVSETTIAVGSTVPSIPVQSKITLPGRFGGRTTLVVSSSVGDTGGLLAEVEHNEYALA